MVRGDLHFNAQAVHKRAICKTRGIGTLGLLLKTRLAFWPVSRSLAISCLIKKSWRFLIGPRSSRAAESLSRVN